MKQSKKLFLGFTRQEWLVILVTLWLVGALAFWNLEKGRRKQRDIARKAVLGEISKAMLSYFEVYGRYPARMDRKGLYGCGAEGEEICLWRERWEDNQFIYMEKLPVDPRAITKADWPHFGYRVSEDGKNFWLWAQLEEKDEDIAGSFKRCPGNWQENWYLVCQFEGEDGAF